jgi:23S rRNA pseudouridine2605 synthase
MRLQRALARAGIASRRAAEVLIEAGTIRVDGKVATLGMKVDPDKQRITVGGKSLPRIERRWLAFHKPLGVVTTADDEEGRRTVFDFIKEPRGLAYVGRLDVMTTGLLLLTTDGDAIHRLTHPKYRIPRSYVAMVHGRPTAEVSQAVTQPVILDGRKVEATRVRVRPGKDGRTLIDLTLVEGRNRVVRRWCEEMGLKVERLARLTYGPVRLGDLPAGQSRPLTPDEEEMIYRSIKLSEGPVGKPARSKWETGERGTGNRDRAGKPATRTSFIEKREAKRAAGSEKPKPGRGGSPGARDTRGESHRKDVRSAKPRPASGRDRKPKR